MNVKCLSCGYDRTGLSVIAPCPECGDAGNCPLELYRAIVSARITITSLSVVLCGCGVGRVLAFVLHTREMQRLTNSQSANAVWTVIAHAIDGHVLSVLSIFLIVFSWLFVRYSTHWTKWRSMRLAHRLLIVAAIMQLGEIVLHVFLRFW